METRLAVFVAASFLSSASAQTPLTPVWRTDGLGLPSGYGSALDGVGDLDADGFADLAVGEPYIDLDAATQVSRLYWFAGGVSGPGETPDRVYYESENFLQLGRSISNADVNGDGFSDLLAGTQKRLVRAYHGSPIGPSHAPDWSVTVADAGADTVVAGAGDVNGDGYEDVVVGLPYCGRGEAREGCAYLYLGSASGLSTTAAWTAESDRANAQFGRSVEGIGDVDGDGFDDVAVGAPYYGNYAGRVYVFRGAPSGLVAAGAIDGAGVGDEFGTALAAVGDGNADGRADLLVGSPRADGAVGVDQGRAVVLPGTASGIGTIPLWEVGGTEAHALLGESVAGIGDFDRDGFGDLAVGAPRRDVGPGKTFVYRGRANGWETAPSYVATAPDAPGCFGCAVAGAGDVNGDGFSELLVGDAGGSRAFLYSLRTTPGSTIAEDGGAAPLTVTLVPDPWGGLLDLAWGNACSGEDDYNLYEGTLGDFGSHVPLACGTFHETSVSFTTPPGSTYYLVVPRGFGTEGSYGTGRGPGAEACAPQQIADCP